MKKPSCHNCASCYAVLSREDKTQMPWCGERSRPIRADGCELFEPRDDGDALDLESRS